jgi:hypothetical protein
MKPFILRFSEESPSESDLSGRDFATSDDLLPRVVARRGKAVEDPGTRVTEVDEETTDDE